jgi:hypothetical protein
LYLKKTLAPQPSEAIGPTSEVAVTPDASPLDFLNAVYHDLKLAVTATIDGLGALLPGLKRPPCEY